MDRTSEKGLHGMLAGDWQPLEALPIRVWVLCGRRVSRFQQWMGISELRHFAGAMVWYGDRVAPDKAIATNSPSA
jgi:hypothetical protein